MQVLKYGDYEAMSAFTANEIALAIIEKQNITLCFASGHTPVLTCELLVEKLLNENIDTSQITFLGLDEWVGLPPDNEGSCHYFFQNKLIKPLNLKPSQYFLFNGTATDLSTECLKMDQRIKDANGIDIMLVGLGMNGHIGFNEPGVSSKLMSHVIDLEEITKSVGVKYFKGEVNLSQGITVGLGHLMNTKKVYLQANGLKKAEVIQETIEGPITESFPASIMQLHKCGYVIIDIEAGSLLKA